MSTGSGPRASTSPWRSWASPSPWALATELTVYRILQEALTNTIKHASASEVRVVLHYTHPFLELTVADDGSGHRVVGLRWSWHRGHARKGESPGGVGDSGPGTRSGLGRVGHVATRHDWGQDVTIRVLLVDDQELLRLGFKMILAQEPDIEVVGEAGDGAEAIALASQCDPHVVLMDIRMPVIDGIEATRRIVADNPAVRVLVLTTFDLDAYAFGALRAGASGFLLKDVPPVELVAGIRIVARGDAVVSPRITRRLLEEHAHLLDVPGNPTVARDGRDVSTLTDREHEVFIAVAEGLSNAEIADRLFVSEATVKSHVGRILGKLGLRDRVQAVVFAFETGIVRPRGRL